LERRPQAVSAFRILRIEKKQRAVLREVRAFYAEGWGEEGEGDTDTRIDTRIRAV
jgi:hypothetical protein